MKLTGSDLRALGIFDAVVRHRGFAAAQAELNISQPTISNHITALEQRLGVRLCQRGHSGFKLTEKGAMVHAAAARLLRTHDDFAFEVEELKGHLVGELKIGIVDSIATDERSKLHEAIGLFQQRSNDVTLHLYQETPQEMQRKLIDGDLHMGVGSFPHKISGLDYRPLYEEKHGLYCAEGHRLFDVPDAALDADRLRQEQIVSRGYWRDEYRKNLGFNNVAAVVYQIEPQLILVRSGHYVGFLPDHLAQWWVDAGKLRCLAPDRVSYTCEFSLALRKGYRKTRVIGTFLEDITEAYGV